MQNNVNVLELLKGLKDELENALPIMEGREKGTLVEGVKMTIKDWGYMMGKDDNGNDKEYACVIVKEDDKNFYFLNSVPTDKLKKIDSLYDEKTLALIKDNGIPVVFEIKKSKDKFKYQDMRIEL